MKPNPRLVLAALAAAALVLAGCGASSTTSETTSAGSATTSGAELSGKITVSGGTSLTEAFTKIGKDFSAAHPGVEVAFNFDSSTTLSTQILAGAPADVFAPADEANMTKLTDKYLIAGEPQVFVRNELVIVTKPGNPKGIKSLADLPTSGVISLCGEKVPCGKYAAESLQKAGVTIDESNITRGQDVGAALTAVAEGDAVAGIVYVTDAKKAGGAVEAVPIPAEVNVIATYPIGVVAASTNIDVAKAFMAYVLGDEGQAVLAEYGFVPAA